MSIKENKTIPSILLKISSFIILLSAIYTLYNLITMKPIATEEAFKFGKNILTIKFSIEILSFIIFFMISYFLDKNKLKNIKIVGISIILISFAIVPITTGGYYIGSFLSAIAGYLLAKSKW